MADMTVVAAQVVPVQGSQPSTKLAAVAIVAGKALYVDANNHYNLAQCDGTTLEASFAGVSVNDAAVGQPVQATTSGLITLGAGAAVSVAQIYCVSRTAGGICPYADLLPGDRLSIIGTGKASNQLMVAPNNTGDVKP